MARVEKLSIESRTAMRIQDKAARALQAESMQPFPIIEEALPAETGGARSAYNAAAADAGTHTWTNGFTLNTPGSQTISATIYDAPGINGSATVTVSQ